MDATALRKRKRPITSCVECYRRKQKCDRELPCAICINRGVPEKCSFSGYDVEVTSETILPPMKRVALLPTSTISIDVHTSNDVSGCHADLGEQTGYSTANSSNFSILQKSLQKEDDDIPQTAPHLPEFVLYQISQIERQLPARTTQAQLIDLYSKECWWWFHGLDPVSCRQRWELWHACKKDNDGKLGKDHEYFSALLFQVLAVALQYLQSDRPDIYRLLHVSDDKSVDMLSHKYSNSGVQIMDILGRNDSTVTAVQHDMLRGVYLKNASRGTESWYCLGTAIRQAQEIGLHLKRDPPPSLSGKELNEWLWQDEIKKRVWVCLFDWDAHVALTLGRPRIINASDCAQVSITLCNVPSDRTISSPSEASQDKSRPFMVTTIEFHNRLGNLLHKMMNCGADKPSLTDYSILEDLNTELNSLLGRLNPYFRYDDPDTSWDLREPAIPDMRFHLISMANTYVVAMHRAHVLRRPESCEAAIAAALKTLSAQEELFDNTDKHKWRIYTYSFYTIDASIFLAALLLEAPATLKHDSTNRMSEALLKSLDRLEQMKEASPMASAGAQILRKCQERLKQRGILWNSPTPVGIETENSMDQTADAIVRDDTYGSASLRAWIEQMDQVMLPLAENNPGVPFDNALWDMLFEG